MRILQRFQLKTVGFVYSHTVAAGQHCAVYLYFALYEEDVHAGVYIFLIEGEIKVDGTVLSRRDGMGVYETDSFELETLQDSHILLIEVPM